VEPARPVPPFTISETVTYGWTATFRNFGPLMLVSLVVFVGNALAILIGEVNTTAGFEIAFNLIAILIDVLLILGLIRASLDVVQGRRPSLGEVFRPEGAGPYLVASVCYLVGVNLGLVVFVVPGVIFGLIFQFYGYVIAEHPDISATTALRRSAEITKGARLRLLGLALVLLFVNLTGAVICIVGLVVTYAITATTLAHTYRTLTGQPVVTL
jgi:uncharacterized membrane protein